MAEPRSPDLRARLREPLAAGPGVPPAASGPAPSPPSRASPGEVGIAIAPCPAPVAPRSPMATRVLTMSARLGPVPQPPATQDEPVFAQLKPVLGAANPARDAALFPGDDLKHAHHHPPAQPAPPPAAGPRLPSEELVQVSRAAGLPPRARACPATARRGRQGPLQAGARGSPVPGWAAPPCALRRGAVEVDGGAGRGPSSPRSAQRRLKTAARSRAPCLFSCVGMKACIHAQLDLNCFTLTALSRWPWLKKSTCLRPLG